MQILAEICRPASQSLNKCLSCCCRCCFACTNVVSSPPPQGSSSCRKFDCRLVVLLLNVQHYSPSEYPMQSIWTTAGTINPSARTLCFAFSRICCFMPSRFRDNSDGPNNHTGQGDGEWLLIMRHFSREIMKVLLYQQ